MEHRNDGIERWMTILKKYKFVILILLLGAVLMSIDIGKKELPEEKTISEHLSDEEYAAETEERLAQILSKVSGAGQVRVMLTLKSGSRTEYQMDEAVSADTESSKTQEERKTVILSEGSAYDKAAITAVQYPVFQGALVICEGADDPGVRLDIINGVAALTGLKSDSITVAKMK